MMNHIVHIAGNDAQAFTHVSWRLILRNSSGEDVREGSAWYDDLLLRSNGAWLIRKRECKVSWALKGSEPRLQASWAKPASTSF
jgi:hypothetical protein